MFRQELPFCITVIQTGKQSNHKKSHLPYVLSFVEMKTALGTALYSAREFSPFTYKLQRLSTQISDQILPFPMFTYAYA